MLADRNDRARLRLLLAFARVSRESNLVSDSQSLEALMGEGISMEVDLRAIACIDEAILLLDDELGNPAVARGLVRLDVSALAARMILELPAHRIEAIADRDIDVFMGMVLGRIALHDDLLARNLEIDANVEKAALAMEPAGGLDDDATANDAAMELLELRAARGPSPPQPEKGRYGGT
jgi:hypothetical protein